MKLSRVQNRQFGKFSLFRFGAQLIWARHCTDCQADCQLRRFDSLFIAAAIAALDRHNYEWEIFTPAAVREKHLHNRFKSVLGNFHKTVLVPIESFLHFGDRVPNQHPHVIAFCKEGANAGLRIAVAFQVFNSGAIASVCSFHISCSRI